MHTHLSWSFINSFCCRSRQTASQSSPTILWNPRTVCRPLEIDHLFSGWASETNALMFWLLFYRPTLPSAGNACSSPANNNHSDWMIPKRFQTIQIHMVSVVCRMFVEFRPFAGSISTPSRNFRAFIENDSFSKPQIFNGDTETLTLFSFCQLTGRNGK